MTNSSEILSSREISSFKTCDRCGSLEFIEANTRAAFWENDELFVIEDIPALVCASCREQHYSDETVVKIDRLRGSGFPADKASRLMAVPVFSLDDPPLLKEELQA